MSPEGQGSSRKVMSDQVPLVFLYFNHSHLGGALDETRTWEWRS